MAPEAVTRTRVLLAHLEPLALVGMSRILADGGIEVVGDLPGDRGMERGEVLAETERLLPDAVVVGFDGRPPIELSDRLRAVAPGAKVILWARDESTMNVFDPGSTEPRLVHPGLTAALLDELGQQEWTLREE